LTRGAPLPANAWRLPASAAAAAAATATAAAAATAALFGFIHAKCAAVEIGAVHRLDGALRLSRGAHGHEAEAARLARHAVRYQVDINHFAAGGESLAERVLG
jgi:hypothetical protein